MNARGSKTNIEVAAERYRCCLDVSSLAQVSHYSGKLSNAVI